MIRVLIVDDEILVRNNLRNIIDWGSNGFVICGEAINGNTALEAIARHNPHIVIMDISMPLMDGVELSQRISERFRNVKMIVLSSYDSFDYVRDTMKNGAVDYILKHKLDTRSLLELLKNVKDEIQSEIRQRDEIEQITRKWDIISPSAQQSFIRDLVLGINNNTDEIVKYFDTMGLENFTSNTVAVVMQIVNFLIVTENYSDRDKSLFVKSVIDLYNESVIDKSNSIITYIEQGKYVILFSFGQQRSEASITGYLHDCLNKISETVGLYLGINVMFGISRLCPKISNISQYYEQACRSSEGLFASNTSNSVKTGSTDNEPFISLSITQEKNLLSAIEALDFEKAEAVIAAVLNGPEAGNISLQSCQMCINELISIADKVARKEGVIFNRINNNEVKWRDKFSSRKNLKDVHSLILNYYHSLIENLKKNKHTGYSNKMLEAVEYIHGYYRDNISLNDVADTIGLSPQYLSSLFKKEAGIGFNDYLNSIRIEKAKELIETGRSRVKAIYNLVGFNNYSYFFKVFKEITGITPIEYSKKTR